MNETFEFIRTFIYLFLAIFVFDLGIIVSDARISLFAISFQFLSRAILLFCQVVNPLGYRELNNWISTPAVILVLISVVVNLWILRRD